MTCECGWPMTVGEIHWRNGEAHEAVERRQNQSLEEDRNAGL